MQSGNGVKEPHLGIGTPFDAHLRGFIDKVDLGVECALRVGRQLVELFDERELLCFQRVTPRAEQIKRLTILKKDGLLTFMDDQLRAEVEVLDRMLPDKRVIVAFILDDASKPVLFDCLGHHTLMNVVFKITHRTHIGFRAFGRAQTHTALCAGKLPNLILLRHGVDWLMADRALRLFAPGLVKNNHIPAVRTLTRSKLFRADVDGISAGTVDLLPCKYSGLTLGVFSAVGTFYNKPRHMFSPFRSDFPPQLFFFHVIVPQLFFPQLYFHVLECKLNTHLQQLISRSSCFFRCRIKVGEHILGYSR